MSHSSQLVNDMNTMQNYIELGRCVTYIQKFEGLIGLPEPRLMGLPPQRPKPVPKPYQTATIRGAKPSRSNPAEDLIELPQPDDF